MVDDFIERLSHAVALDTVSPMSDAQKSVVDRLLASYGLDRVAEDVWARPPSGGAVWCYSHIDTKPALPREEWLSPPHDLRREDSRLVGLGISDAKFQLLNMLDIFRETSWGILVDGGEESGAHHASKYLKRVAPESLLIVDGSGDPDEDYGQTLGQLDGVLHYASGRAPIHPGREKRGELLAWLSDIATYTDQLHFNVTGLGCPTTVRSLTVETLSLRFDLRFRADQMRAAQEFVARFSPDIKQHYEPLYGRDDGNHLAVAGFSCPLKGLDTIRHLRVAPGGRPANGAHRPNEWIDISQVNLHRERLLRLRDDESWRTPKESRNHE